MRSRYFLVAPLAAAIALSSSLSPSSTPDCRARLTPAGRTRRPSTIRSSSPSPSTTRTSRSCATSATCSCRRAASICSSWTSPRRSIPRRCISARSPSRRASSVLEQNYEYDLLEPEKLLRKYVGRDVTLVRTVQQNGTTRQEEVKARLLSYNNAPVWRIGNEIVTGLHADHIRFPELPDNLYQPADADLDAAERRRAAAPRRGVVSRAASWRGTPTTC